MQPQEGVEVLIGPKRIAVDAGAGAGAVRTRNNGNVQPGRTVTTSALSTGCRSGFSGGDAKAQIICSAVFYPCLNYLSLFQCQVCAVVSSLHISHPLVAVQKYYENWMLLLQYDTGFLCNTKFHLRHPTLEVTFTIHSNNDSRSWACGNRRAMV